MTVDDGVRVVAGVFVLISLALSVWVSHYWLWFTAFTGFCPAAMLLKKAGLKEPCCGKG